MAGMYPICAMCNQACEEPCAAVEELLKVYQDIRLEQKEKLIKELRKQLGIKDCEVADDLRELGMKLINALPELSIIRDFDIKIAYVWAYYEKKDKGRIVNADCRKVSGPYAAFLPFDFVITFYEPNMHYMTENQRKILMLHELRHIGIGERGFRLENHDVEDFSDLLMRYGIKWNGLSQDVPDILAGGDGEKGKKK